MSRWFRLYADAMRNPKVLKLSDKEFRLWVRMLSIASENDGRVGPLDELKLVFNVRLDHLSTGVERLLRAGLMDRLEVGYAPRNWDKFQYKSDTSTDRVTKHRAKRNVSVTPPDTDTESDTEVIKDEPLSQPRKRAASFEIPSDIPSDPWKHFVEMRVRIKKPMTEHAKDLAVAKLRKLRDEDGWPPGDVLDHCTLNNYQGIFPPNRNNGNGQRNGNSASGHGKAIDAGFAFIADGGHHGSAAG